MFEITERTLVTPEEAVDLSLHRETTLRSWTAPPRIDPLLDWEPDPE